MKIRFDKNSVRYRLRKSDVEQLLREGCVREYVAFPNGIFAFELRRSRERDLSAVFNGNVTVSIPSEILNQWANTGQVAISGKLETAAGEYLSILIEKDFPCKNDPSENARDTFAELADRQSGPGKA